MRGARGKEKTADQAGSLPPLRLPSRGGSTFAVGGSGNVTSCCPTSQTRQAPRGRKIRCDQTWRSIRAVATSGWHAGKSGRPAAGQTGSLGRTAPHTASGIRRDPRWLSHQIAHARQSDRLAAGKRLAVGGADRPAPKRGLIAQLVQERGRIGGPAADELTAIAPNRG
jgi:hypothetical protein